MWNLILVIFFSLLMLCAIAVIIVAVLSMMGVFGLGIQVSSEPMIHREITKAELAFILALAVLVAALSLWILRRMYI